MYVCTLSYKNYISQYLREIECGDSTADEKAEDGLRLLKEPEFVFVRGNRWDSTSVKKHYIFVILEMSFLDKIH